MEKEDRFASYFLVSHSDKVLACEHSSLLSIVNREVIKWLWKLNVFASSDDLQVFFAFDMKSNFRLKFDDFSNVL